ncbi:MAG: hypothetical protein JXB85_08665 [Anaerolineales bacterium]|nr:hypothetical protein [Anaerolineales bacterium]
MDEIRTQPEGQLETGEALSTEQQALDDTTLNPRAYVEQTGDYQPAEAIQATLAEFTKNETGAAGNDGVPPLLIPRPEDQGIIGSQPRIRGDLDQAITASGDEPEGDDATPINLPGPQAASVTDFGATPLPIPYVAGHPEQSGRIGVDPLTGKEFGGEEQEGHPPEPLDLNHDLSPEHFMDTSEMDTGIGQMPKMRQDLSNLTATASQDKEEDGKNEATPITLPGPEGMASVEADAASQADPHRLTPDALPEQAKDFAGEDIHGMVDKSKGPGTGPNLGQKMGPGKNMGLGTGPGTSGSGPDRIGNQPGMTMPGGKGPGSPSAPTKGSKGGSSSSESGPPINTGTVPGGGGKSREPGAPAGVDQKAWGKHQRSLDVQAMEKGSTTVKDKDTGDTYTIGSGGVWRKQEDDPEIPPQGDPIDGMSPMPYTGKSSGSKPEPHVVGGRDIESGKFTPIVSIGGKTVGGTGTVGPDDLDDSGKFYGGISASIGRPNNPDDPDYYTPDVLEQAEKSKKIS